MVGSQSESCGKMKKHKFRFSMLGVLCLITLFAIVLSVIDWPGSMERTIRADAGLRPSTTLEIVSPVHRNEHKKLKTVWLLLHEDDKCELRVLHRDYAPDSRWISPEKIAPDAKGLTSLEQLTLRLHRNRWHFEDRPDQRVIDSIIDNYMFRNRLWQRKKVNVRLHLFG